SHRRSDGTTTTSVAGHTTARGVAASVRVGRALACSLAWFASFVDSRAGVGVGTGHPGGRVPGWVVAGWSGACPGGLGGGVVSAVVWSCAAQFSAASRDAGRLAFLASASRVRLCGCEGLRGYAGFVGGFVLWCGFLLRVRFMLGSFEWCAE
ncbi:hypothetical protein, partial [Nocardiopsis nanhaiensis]